MHLESVAHEPWQDLYFRPIDSSRTTDFDIPDADVRVNLDVHASAEGYRNLEEPVFLEISDPPQDVELEIGLEAYGESVAVRLLLPDGSPAAGAEVRRVDSLGSREAGFVGRDRAVVVLESCFARFRFRRGHGIGGVQDPHRNLAALGDRDASEDADHAGRKLRGGGQASERRLRCDVSC